MAIEDSSPIVLGAIQHVIDCGYKFHGTHAIHFRPRKEDRAAVQELLDGAWAVIDTYHDQKETDNAQET